MKKLFTRQNTAYAAVFVVAVGLTLIVAALLTNIIQRKAEETEYPLQVVEIGEDEIDPAVWGKNFPDHYDRFIMTRNDGNSTPYGGSEVYSKLERYPAMVRLWAGYAFSKDHNEERGHYYAQIDQANTQRVKLVDQPGACINCHAAEAPALIEQMGWEEFNHTPYNELADDIHTGSSCSDCHNPDTMELVITRPAFRNAMEARGVNLDEATRQEMRSYVCAQCHVEYYFKGDNKVLTFPWSQGFTIDDIEAHYDSYEFKDWTHAETGAPMIKIQHPEFEMWTTGIHARSGVACADCHMPYIRQGSVKISDHWLRSPLENINSACQTCHRWDEEELRDRVVDIQDTTAGLLRKSEEAIISAIDTIVAAKEAGATDEDLAVAYQLHRSSQLRWDFVSSENSTGFHSPQEAARVLANSIDLARQSELSAWLVLVRLNPSAVEAVEAGQ
ncbi:MAG: ammonia-forming cytochrome c nitrite reductase subunit c552 [Anaerolineae bacterium]|nr:ammonia-forming cytochrome c nitrite reductase subunit c552 [Anaerolineae bacterium]